MRSSADITRPCKSVGLPDSCVSNRLGRSDKYMKPGLAPAIHRVRMCELAVDQTSNWLMVDPWEASQAEYQRTAVVLEHFDLELNQNQKGGIMMKDGKCRKYPIWFI